MGYPKSNQGPPYIVVVLLGEQGKNSPPLGLESGGNKEKEGPKRKLSFFVNFLLILIVLTIN